MKITSRAVSVLLALTASPAVSDDDVLQKALNYIFRGDIGAPGVSIVDRKACVVKVVSMGGGLEQTFFLRAVKSARIENQLRQTTYGPQYRPVISLEGDGTVMEETVWPGTKSAETSRTKKTAISIIGDVERTQNALHLVVSDFCQPEASKLPF